MGHLLVTNDYPPKIGGIQSYLYELWRRLPPERVTVLTTGHRDAAEFDRQAPHRIVRLDRKMLLPTRSLVTEIRALAKQVDASLVILDPVFPIGAIGPHLGLPYALIVHGAELTIPGRLAGTRDFVRRSLRNAELIIAAGNFPAAEARRIGGSALPEIAIIPPGVDAERFRPLDAVQRQVVRRRLGVAPEAQLVVSVSRLVPRKGMDVLIEASEKLYPTHPNLEVLIGGTGRDERRLRNEILRRSAPVRLLGAIEERDLGNIYGAADLFVMLARDRWLGLEQEGFGIVYLEAAACGIAQVAGKSGGTTDAVEDGVTGFVVDRAADTVVATKAIGRLLDDQSLRDRFAQASRDRTVRLFSYDNLASELDEAIKQHEGQIT